MMTAGNTQARASGTSSPIDRPSRSLRVTEAYAKPELLATKANEVWSWDITKLLGPVKWTYFYSL
jgi:hypothetical protein